MKWWRRYLDWRTRNVGALASTSDGFIAQRANSCVQVRWADIRRAVVFKRDLLTTDVICIGFETEEGFVEIDEEMRGYEDVEAEMEKALAPGPDWKLRVMFPAFEPNPATLFERAVT